jgi:hypothetical protein
MILAASLGAALSAAAPVDWQSLADMVRASEVARNATAGRPPVKVYTNKDLPPVDRSPTTALPPANASAPVGTGAVPMAEPATPAGTAPAARDESYWRERMRPLRERVDRARARADETKRRADELMRASDRCFMIGIVCADYTESLRLSELHKGLLSDVARAEREVAALEEEARRAGVPPGWLRL